MCPYAQHVGNLRIPIISEVSTPVVPFFVVKMVHQEAQGHIVFRLGDVVREEASRVKRYFRLFGRLLRFFLHIHDERGGLMVHDS